MTHKGLMIRSKKRNKPINPTKVTILVVIVLYLIAEIIMAINKSKTTYGNVSYNELLTMIDNKEVESVDIIKTDSTCKINTTDGKSYIMINPQNDNFIHELMERGVNINYRKTSLSDSITSLILTLPMMVIVAMIMIYLTNTIIGGSTKMFSLIKSDENTTRFDDIKGINNSKKDIKFLVSQLTNWSELDKVGARPIKGVLLYGPPGTGKTMIAKAIAKEANVNFISASGSDFNEMFVGVGAARIRQLWQMAQANTPCIIFIDEIDCVGKRRRGGDGLSSEHNQTINCLLQRMDGINATPGIMVIAATNKKEDLDKALLRPGRFDRQLFIGPPSTKADRDELVEHYLKGKLLLENKISVEDVSKLLTGFTGAEVEETLNEAVYISMADGRHGVIRTSDVDEAVMKITLGAVKDECKSEKDETIVAYHEAGHALTSLLLGVDITKVSITSYSNGVGGITVRDLDKNIDNKLRFKTDYMNDIKILLGGKVAEELVYGEHTQGCSNDIEKATQLVYEMVTQLAFGKHTFNENILIESGVNHIIEKDIIDECNGIMSQCNIEVKEMLDSNMELLAKLANRLKEEHTIVCPTLESIQ